MGDGEILYINYENGLLDREEGLQRAQTGASVAGHTPHETHDSTPHHSYAKRG
jgi:hypothetical protein